MNQVSRTSHLAFRRHVVARHVGLDDLEIVGLPNHAMRDAAGLAETGAGDDGDPSLNGWIARMCLPPMRPLSLPLEHGTAALSASATSGRNVEATRHRPP